MTTSMQVFSWVNYAQGIVKQEMNFLRAFYRDLPEVKINILEDVKGTKVELADRSVDGFTKGEYSITKMYINLYIGSILKFSGDSHDKFREQVMTVLAHEFHHHYQFQGTNRARYVRWCLEDRKNNVAYWDKRTEVEAREAQEWYINRRQVLTLKMA